VHTGWVLDYLHNPWWFTMRQNLALREHSQVHKNPQETF
jgi:hypothetical protein